MLGEEDAAAETVAAEVFGHAVAGGAVRFGGDGLLGV